MLALHSEFTQLKVKFPFMLPKQCQHSTQPMDISHYVGLHRKLLELFRDIWKSSCNLNQFHLIG